MNLSGNPIFGDPKQLKSAKISHLHPSSWYVDPDIDIYILAISDLPRVFQFITRSFMFKC